VLHEATHLLPLAVIEQAQAEFWGMAGLVVLGVPVQAAWQAEDNNIAIGAVPWPATWITALLGTQPLRKLQAATWPYML
jgi:hypothetical protein